MKEIKVREMSRVELPTTVGKIDQTVKDTTMSLAEKTIIPLRDQFGEDSVTTKSGFDHDIMVMHGALYVEVFGTLIVPDEIQVVDPA